MNKKLLALFLACFLPVALLAGSGDVNGDGKIDVVDIVEIVNYLENHPSEKFKTEEADVNNDGTIDNGDVEALAENVKKGEGFHDNVYFGCESGNLTIVASPLGGVIEVPIIGSTELKVKVDCIPNMRQLDDIIKDGVRYVRLEIDEVDVDIKDCWIAYNAENAEGWGNAFCFYQPNKNAPSLDELKEALVDLYYATDGDNWTDNTNWLSEKPVSEWYGVNNSRFRSQEKVLGDYILFVDLMSNNLYGQIPQSSVKLMNILDVLNLQVNYLYGEIPKSIIQHPNWHKFGWNIIMQDEICHGQALTLENYNLKADNDDVELFVEEKLSSVDNILKQNELTLVFNYGTVAEIADLTDDRVNLFLDFCNKGLGMVVQIGDWMEDGNYLPYDEYRNHVKKMCADRGLPNNIQWIRSANNFGNAGLSIFGSMCLFDKDGNVVGYWMKHGMDLRQCEYYYNHKIDSVLRSRLGTPDEHEKYTSLYTSTDYSEDGRVIQLQEATVGNGVDLVFVGECFVDTDMGEYGLYENTMREYMEQFFTEEPYTSLRNRFNVYAVCAVSPNNTYQTDAKYAIAGSVEKAFEYAKKAVGDRDDRIMVTVICKPNSIPERSVTYMFEGDGSFAAFLFENYSATETTSKVINHEVGGHGIALLLDEYVEPGMEKNSPTDDSKAMLDAVYEVYGEGANVDWRSNPEEVKWAHFLNDPRYAEEKLGVFEGSWLYGIGAYRPSENSTMRHNEKSSRFNAPSREAIYKRVMKLSEGDDWTYDYETFVAFDAPAREAYKVAQARSSTRGAEAQPKRRIESRPPTIYKGTWRDAGKCEKIEYDKRQSN